MMKKVILSNTESKRVDYAHTYTAMKHNGGTSGLPATFHLNAENNASLWPLIGDGESNRNGSDIYGVGWTIRMQVNIPQDRLNAKFRCAVIRAVKGSNPVGTYTDMMDNVTGNVMIDPFDKDRVSVVKQFWLSPGKSLNPAVSTGKEITRYKKIFVPLKQTVKFFDDTSLKNSLLYDYYLIMWGYDTYTSLLTDTVGSVQLWQRLTYKDK